MKVFENFFSMDELPWDDLHHRSLFLPELDRFENEFLSIFTIDYVKEPHNPISITNSDSNINFGNISTTVPIDISDKHGVIENIHIGASCTIDEINTYKTLFQESCEIFSWSYE